MKIFFTYLFSFYLILSSCTNGNIRNSNLQKNDSICKDTSLKSTSCFVLLNNPDEFLNCFKDFEIKDLKVEYNDNPLNKVFAGVLMDKKYFPFLSQFYFKRNICYSSAAEFSENYGCYKFKISNERLGLIIRRMDMYAPNAVDLLIWNNKTKTIENLYLLADKLGDAGFYINKVSWLSDIDNDNKIDIITRSVEFVPSGLPDNDGVPPGRTYDSIIFYKGNGTLYNMTITDVIIDSTNSDGKLIKRILHETKLFDSNYKSKLDVSKYRN